jgi:tRNA pseudouridine32 synthase / 23S rRNA pseudouridine746 synthase
MARLRPNAPPSRQGVSASCVVLPPASPGPVLWRTVFDFLIDRFPHINAQAWADRLQRGDVVTADGATLDPQSLFEPGLRVYYFRAVPDEAHIPFEHTVLYRDTHLLVVDKPHFLPVVPSGHYVRHTLLARLKTQLDLDDLTPVHRIDRDTAGLVMFSLMPATRNHFHALFRARRVHKTYEAVAQWNPNLPWKPDGTLRRATRITPSSTHFMQMMEWPDAPADQVNAVTDIRVLQVSAGLVHLELHPLTGQRHQLRVHLNALGMPIQNDGIYPKLTPEGQASFTCPLQLLARSLEFVDPVSGQDMIFRSSFSLSFSKCADARASQHLGVRRNFAEITPSTAAPASSQSGLPEPVPGLASNRWSQTTEN